MPSDRVQRFELVCCSALYFYFFIFFIIFLGIGPWVARYPQPENTADPERVRIIHLTVRSTPRVKSATLQGLKTGGY